MISLSGRHPEEARLALYSSGDLNPMERFLIGLHLRSCVRCAGQADSFTAVSSILRSQGTEMPQGVQWERLAAEMTANIHLGLEAGECVGPVRPAKAERIGFRAALVMAGLSVVLASAWLLNPPRRAEKVVRASPIEIRTSPGGIEMQENGSALILMHTRGQQKPIIVSTPGSLRARFVDQDTGQVTINNVYSD
jgi:hypothetical protein